MGGLLLVLLLIGGLWYIFNYLKESEEDVNKELDEKFEEEMKKYD